MDILDLFTYINLAICLMILRYFKKVISLNSNKGRTKILAVYMILLSILYICANVIFLFNRHLIVYLENLRPVYDCVMLLMFNLSLCRILENSDE